MLVIDGASSDATLKVVESFGSDAIRVFSEKDKGVYDAMNKGFHLFEGDAVGFLNSDDTFHDSRDAPARADDPPRLFGAHAIHLGRRSIDGNADPHVWMDPELWTGVVGAVRATLLAALRCAVLWRQVGGSYWDLLLSRRRMVDVARELVATS